MEHQPNPFIAVDDDDKLHILMFPWLAFGHMIPFLELSKLIAQKGHRVTFVSTPKNIDRLPKLSSNISPLINLVKLPLPIVDKLPENAEATVDLPYHLHHYLKKAYDQLQQPITQLIQDTLPDWVIYDFAPYWLGPIAGKLGISTAFFSAFICASLCFFGPSKVLAGLSEDKDDRTKPEDFTVSPKWVPFESNIAFRLFEIMRVLDDVAPDDEETVSGMYRFGASVEGCDVVLVRSSYEFEPEWIKLLPEIYQKPIIPVGLLPPITTHGGSEEDNGEWGKMKTWLDKQLKGSVVYVAFGSESQSSQADITELAHGLEKSGFPFFWVMRNRCGWDNTKLIELPNEFEERTKGRGVVWTSWAPQLKILSHESVGGFLSHSGLSSVIEAIHFEKPMILFTSLADTGLIARLLEEKKLGYLIPRDELDGSFTSDSVAESLRLVMVEDEGKIYRDKVKEMKGLIAGGDIQARYTDNMVDYLIKHRR